MNKDTNRSRPATSASAPAVRWDKRPADRGDHTPSVSPPPATGSPPQSWNAPRTPRLDNQNQSYASALSFVGSTRRITAWTERHTENVGTAANAGIWTGAIALMLITWVIVIVWYALLLLPLIVCLTIPLLWPFVPFTLAVFGFRSHRRSQRKAQYTSEIQLATMQAMLANQQRDNEKHG